MSRATRHLRSHRQLRPVSTATAAIFSSFLLLTAHRAAAQEKLTLKPTPKTVAWGYYDAKAAPVLRVKSGDTVEIQTLIANSAKRLEDAGVAPDQIEQSLRDKHLSRDDAYMLSSVAADLHITELVDGNKGIHMMLPKSIFTTPREEKANP